MISPKRRRDTHYKIVKRLKDVVLARPYPEMDVLKQPHRLAKRTGLGHNKSHWCCNHKGDRKSEKQEQSYINEVAEKCY